MTRQGCTGTASGRLCVASDNGEVGRIEFYGLYEEYGVCHLDPSAPFVITDQEIVDDDSGLRFPTRVRTIYPTEVHDPRRPGASGAPREVDVITQIFSDCVFPDVRVSQEIGPRERR